MRPFALLIALLSTGCWSSPPAATPAPEPSAPSPTPEPVAEPPAEAPALPEGRLPERWEPVALIGYGIRLELRPPFQAVRLGNILEGAGADGLVVSWWDTSADGAGKSGDAGLHNLIVVPRSATRADAQISMHLEGDPPVTVLRMGEGGTELHLPAGYGALGGAGALSAGPTDPEWRLLVRGEIVPLTPGPMLHSTDPATGSPIAFQDRPSRPWGAWPE